VCRSGGGNTHPSQLYQLTAPRSLPLQPWPVGDERVLARVEARHDARAVVHLSLPYLPANLSGSVGAANPHNPNAAAGETTTTTTTYLRVAQGSPLHHEAAFPRLPAGSSGLHAQRWPAMAAVLRTPAHAPLRTATADGVVLLLLQVRADESPFEFPGALLQLLLGF
jgi:hypothetical protein